MRTKLALLMIVATLAGPAMAGPLVRQHVAQDAKWLLHIDLDQLRTSKLGQYLINEVVVKNVEAAKAQGNPFLTNMDVLKIIGQLHSLTAYGMGFEGGRQFDGVLLLKVEPETRKILEGLAAGVLLKGDGTLTKTNEGGNVLYSLKDELFASPREDGLILFSKSKATLQQALAVLAGKARNLSHSKAFADFPPVADSFIFLVVAEGFQDHLPIPPQAQVLRQADGVRVVLGERASNVFVNVALKAKDAEVLKPIQQVVEGMVALGTLSQSENHDLQQLLQSIKIVATEKVLSLSAAYPVEGLIARAGQFIAEQQQKHHHRKAEHKTAEQPEASADDAK